MAKTKMNFDKKNKNYKQFMKDKDQEVGKN